MTSGLIGGDSRDLSCWAHWSEDKESGGGQDKGGSWEEEACGRGEEEKKLEYLQQLQDEVLVEDATLLESAEGSQIVGSKYKKVILGDEKGWWPSKKTKGKQLSRYYRDAVVKIEGINPCERCMSAGQDCLVYHSG